MSADEQETITVANCWKRLNDDLQFAIDVYKKRLVLTYKGNIVNKFLSNNENSFTLYPYREGFMQVAGHESITISGNSTNEVVEIISKIRYEIMCQYEKWGEQHHDPAIWLAILTEEVGEVAESVLKKESYSYRAELIQVAAVAIQALLDNH